jgi:dATP/dGTP diphosphohydrolase
MKKRANGPGVAKARWPYGNGTFAAEVTIKAVEYTREVPVFMSTDSATRKLMPVTSGCLAYFPDALLLVSFISRVGNDKHNPGQPLHWAKEKSTDEQDCEVRHMLDFLRGEPADPGLEALGDLGHLASKAWRALAHLQRACDAARAEHEDKVVAK